MDILTPSIFPFGSKVWQSSSIPALERTTRTKNYAHGWPRAPRITDLARQAKNIPSDLVGELSLPNGVLRRCITRIESGDGWQVDDGFDANPGVEEEFSVRWQFA